METSQNVACAWHSHAFVKLLMKEETLPYFSTSCQILSFLESSQSSHVVVMTHKPHPQMSDTQQGTWNTLLQVFGSIYPPLHFGYFTPLWNAKSDGEIQVTSHWILYPLVLSISGYCMKFNRRKMFLIMIKATIKYQQIISLLLSLVSVKKKNQNFNSLHNLRHMSSYINLKLP